MKIVNNMKYDTCIYHFNCADGFTAAWAFWSLHNFSANFIAGVHGKTLTEDVTGKNVVFVDFCYQRDEMIRIAGQANSVLVLDHHKGAEENLFDMPENVTVVFDMNRSGAMMTWDYFNEHNLETPDLLKRVQDRDLWRFEYDDSKAVDDYIFSKEYTFDNWDDMVTTPIADLADRGLAIMEYNDKSIAEYIKASSHFITIDGQRVPALNCPYHWSSEAGHILGIDAPFAATYFIKGDTVGFGLRSREDGADVCAIAKKYGGGGHEHASGFSVSLEQFHKMMSPRSSLNGFLEK